MKENCWLKIVTNYLEKKKGFKHKIRHTQSKPQDTHTHTNHHNRPPKMFFQRE